MYYKDRHGWKNKNYLLNFMVWKRWILLELPLWSKIFLDLSLWPIFLRYIIFVFTFTLRNKKKHIFELFTSVTVKLTSFTTGYVSKNYIWTINLEELGDMVTKFHNGRKFVRKKIVRTWMLKDNKHVSGTEFDVLIKAHHI